MKNFKYPNMHKYPNRQMKLIIKHFKLNIYLNNGNKFIKDKK